MLKTNYQILEEVWATFDEPTKKMNKTKLGTKLIQTAKPLGFQGYNKYVWSYVGYKKMNMPISQFLIDHINEIGFLNRIK